MDPVDTERGLEAEAEPVEKRVCECCRGAGVLVGVSVNDPRVRDCEYCDGRGWLQVLPVTPGAYW